MGFFGDGVSMLVGNFRFAKLTATTDSPVPFIANFNNNNSNNSPTELGGPFTTFLQNGGYQLLGDQASSLSSPAYQFSAASLYGITTLNPILQADVDVSNPLGTAWQPGLLARAQPFPGSFYGASHHRGGGGDRPVQGRIQPGEQHADHPGICPGWGKQGHAAICHNRWGEPYPYTVPERQRGGAAHRSQWGQSPAWLGPAGDPQLGGAVALIDNFSLSGS